MPTHQCQCGGPNSKVKSATRALIFNQFAPKCTTSHQALFAEAATTDIQRLGADGVAVTGKIAEAAATEIHRLEAALQEARKEKSAQQEKARKAQKVAQQATTKLAKSHFAKERGSW